MSAGPKILSGGPMRCKWQKEGKPSSTSKPHTAAHNPQLAHSFATSKPSGFGPKKHDLQKPSSASNPHRLPTTPSQHIPLFAAGLSDVSATASTAQPATHTGYPFQQPATATFASETFCGLTHVCWRFVLSGWSCHFEVPRRPAPIGFWPQMLKNYVQPTQQFFGPKKAWPPAGCLLALRVRRANVLQTVERSKAELNKQPTQAVHKQQPAIPLFAAGQACLTCL